MDHCSGDWLGSYPGDSKFLPVCFISLSNGTRSGLIWIKIWSAHGSRATNIFCVVFAVSTGHGNQPDLGHQQWVVCNWGLSCLNSFGSGANSCFFCNGFHFKFTRGCQQWNWGLGFRSIALWPILALSTFWTVDDFLMLIRVSWPSISSGMFHFTDFCIWRCEPKTRAWIPG